MCVFTYADLCTGSYPACCYCYWVDPLAVMLIMEPRKRKTFPGDGLVANMQAIDATMSDSHTPIFVHNAVVAVNVQCYHITLKYTHRFIHVPEYKTEYPISGYEAASEYPLVLPPSSFETLETLAPAPYARSSECVSTHLSALSSVEPLL